MFFIHCFVSRFLLIEQSVWEPFCLIDLTRSISSFCSLSWSQSLSARCSSMFSTAHLRARGCSEWKCRYLPVCVGFRYAFVLSWPCSRPVISVSRKAIDHSFFFHCKINWVLNCIDMIEEIVLSPDCYKKLVSINPGQGYLRVLDILDPGKQVLNCIKVKAENQCKKQITFIKSYHDFLILLGFFNNMNGFI